MLLRTAERLSALRRAAWHPPRRGLGVAGRVAGAALLLAALLAASRYHYLLFHSLVELFAVIVACGIFIIVWNSRRFWQNGYFQFLGVGYLFVGALDLAHTLGYVGMRVFPGHDDDTNLATQLWIVARYVEGLSLVLAPIAPSVIRFIPPTTRHSASKCATFRVKASDAGDTTWGVSAVNWTPCWQKTSMIENFPQNASRRLSGDIMSRRSGYA